MPEAILKSLCMKRIFTTLVLCAVLSPILLAQNVDYEMYISSFYGSSCGNDPGISTTEEHTWLGWTRDNLSTIETYSGCQQVNRNGAATRTGTFAVRNRYNSTATTLYGRIDAWEDDMGDRCTYDTGFNSDDCRARSTCTYPLTNPLEYQWTTRGTNRCGSNDYNMNVYYRYRYTTTTLPNAIENTSETFTTGGTRPFWGSSGNWSIVGGDCATSGTIGHNQTSSFSATVSCKSQVVFRWRVSSQLNGDYLELWINGTRRDRISGNTGWVTRTVNLDFGVNTVEWRYAKDGSTVAGLDRGFVDEVSFINANSVQAGTINGNQTLCSGGDPFLLNSTTTALSYSNSLAYQWQRSTNNATWSNISGATGSTYDPPAGATQTYYYRRRAQDGCGFTAYTNTITAVVNDLPNATLGAPPLPICEGNSTNLIFSPNAGTGPYNIVYNGSPLNGLSAGASVPVSPSSTTTYQITSITDANGCVRTSGLGGPTTVTVQTNSTAPTVTNVVGKQCPNTAITLTAGGGVAGTGSNIFWYTGPNGTGTVIGAGNNITVSPSNSTYYYARREGVCNTTNDDQQEVSIRDFAYVPIGTTAAVDYCTDDQGWHHFYDASDAIIFSLRGDISGATVAPTVSITNNGSYHQSTVGAVGSCINGWSPGEEFFELPRSWNVNFIGTLNPPYTARYYFPSSERTTLENAANAHMAANAACGYTYKYGTPNGFYWFKNTGTAYVAPLFDQPTKLTGATSGSVNGVHYSEIPGITSFSGGSGAVALTADPSLPVELSAFTAWNSGATNTLQWETQSELNNDRFEIERSADGQHFERIGTVKGASNSVVALSYFWEDQTPLLGVNYYRLRQVDHDGTESYSNIVAVLVHSELGEARFFPNPVGQQLTYQFHAQKAESLTLQLTDVLGRVVATWPLEVQVGINTNVLDVTPLAAGMYQATVQNSAGTVLQTESIIKKAP